MKQMCYKHYTDITRIIHNNGSRMSQNMFKAPDRKALTVLSHLKYKVIF